MFRKIAWLPVIAAAYLLSGNLNKKKIPLSELDKIFANCGEEFSVVQRVYLKNALVKQGALASTYSPEEIIRAFPQLAGRPKR